MSQSFAFYDERARTAAAEAVAAQLDNVRDRARRSEAAWRQLADRARKVERDRAVRNAAAAEAQAAALLLMPEPDEVALGEVTE